MFLSGVKESLHLRQKISDKLNFVLPEVEILSSEGLKGDTRRSISVISTTLNEEQNIETWLYALLAQTLAPNELVICDGGSTDSTISRITKWKQDHPKLKVVLVSSPGANIAKGRNVAAKESSSEVLLFSDVGSLPDKEWVRELSLPFLSNTAANVSLGLSECVSDSALAKAVSKLILQDKSEINPKTYLASGRSIGVSREAFIEVDGFPENLTLAGEDTLFNLRLRQSAKSGFYFTPNAVAYWMPPKSFRELWKMMFRYARGDAEAGVFFRDYLSRISEFSAMVFGFGFALLSLNYAISRWQFGVVLITAVALYFASSPILAYQHRLKNFGWREKLAAPFALISAQACGFISGLIFSKKTN